MLSLTFIVYIAKLRSGTPAVSSLKCVPIRLQIIFIRYFRDLQNQLQIKWGKMKHAVCQGRMKSLSSKDHSLNRGSMTHGLSLINLHRGVRRTEKIVISIFISSILMFQTNMWLSVELAAL
jgi:hypothetical protein